MKYEILSPCGSMESFYAAIEAGCDAVYLAGKMFGARSFANNFTNEELIYVINYAHLYSVKVYITCNILIYEHEIDKFLEYIEFLHKNNVDAVIMQDIGCIDLVHKTFPNLEIHGSTQMNIHNLEGALMIEKLGIKRIVLARETPLEIIKEIKEKTNLEIELFVHGALCASYSGMCQFASSIGLRSGNRGTCTGCCRLPYKITDINNKKVNNYDYPLSMKDLMTLPYLNEFIDLGITSFKIEGRMKSPEYVYITTKMYKETRDNYLKTKKITINQNDLYKLNNIFTRSFTKGFNLNENNNNIINELSPNHQGILIGKVIKSKNNYIDILLNDNISIHDGLRILNKNFEYGLILNEFKINNKQVYQAFKNNIITLKVNKNIPINSKVYRTYSYLIEKEIKEIINSRLRKVPITFKIEILKNKKIMLEVSDYINTIKLESIIPSFSLNNSLTKEIIKEKLSKINNTIYKIDKININLDDNLFVPISIINNLKRDILVLLNEKRLNNFKKNYKKEKYTCIVPSFKHKEKYTLLTNNKDFKNSNYSDIYSEVLNDFNVIKKLPKVIDNYNNIDLNKEYLIGEIGALNKLNNIISDYSLNVVNSYSVAYLHSIGVKRITLSLELNLKQIEDLINSYKTRYQELPNLEVIRSTYKEVMILKYNFNDYYKKNCNYLIDRFNNKYKIIFKNNLMYIYDYKRTIIDSDKTYFNIGINYLRDEYYF